MSKAVAVTLVSVSRAMIWVEFGAEDVGTFFGGEGKAASIFPKCVVDELGFANEGV